MKRLMAIAALAVTPLACVANQGDNPVRFVQARALDFDDTEGCTGNEDAFITEGNLDISGGSNYLLAMSVETNTFQQPITIGQEPFSGEGLGDITLNEVVYSYQASRSGVSLPADEVDRVSIYAVFRPETDPEESYMFVRAFGPQALTRLASTITFGAEPVTILTTVKARGRLSGGQVVESNKFTFPVTVVNSGYTPGVGGAAGTCPVGTPRNGVCAIPGQDIRICL
ncbi:hypothetical protein [Archangium lansingense]|uniref:Lipoprotein n=1 Tax=Archangium lansingense TaxID=2995310 RepID=A0ABT4AHH0_9BACT|nr:hypothetical protein [Archangium lansinium]MCY1081138.1 hypothetical protein [Archangium lansinium]